MNTPEMGLHSSEKFPCLHNFIWLEWQNVSIAFFSSVTLICKRVDLACSLVTAHCICDTVYVQYLHRLIAFPDLHPPRYSLWNLSKQAFALVLDFCDLVATYKYIWFGNLHNICIRTCSLYLRALVFHVRCSRTCILQPIIINGVSVSS